MTAIYRLAIYFQLSSASFTLTQLLKIISLTLESRRFNSDFIMTTPIHLRTLCVICGLLLPGLLSASIYYGNQDGSGAGVVGNGSLQLTSSGGSINAQFNRGGTSFSDILVLFLDVGEAGFSSTSPFSESDLSLRSAITGKGVSGCVSTANFASGFLASYAIALGVDQGGVLYHLSNTESGPALEYVRNFSLSEQNKTAGTFSFSIGWNDLGLANNSGFKFESTYISPYGYRSLESFESLSGVRGFSTITFSNYDVFGVLPAPEPTNLALLLFSAVIGLGGTVSWLRRKWALPGRLA